jgi:transposase
MKRTDVKKDGQMINDTVDYITDFTVPQSSIRLNDCMISGMVGYALQQTNGCMYQHTFGRIYILLDGYTANCANSQPIRLSTGQLYIRTKNRKKNRMVIHTPLRIHTISNINNII